MTTSLLPPLEVDTDADIWIGDWKRALKSLNDVLMLSESALMDRLPNDRRILEIVDNFFVIYPKNWRKDEKLSMVLNGTLLSDHEKEIRGVFVELYTKILMLFQKLVKKFAGKQNAQKCIFFDLNRLFRALVIFKASNRNTIENIITEAFNTKQFTEEDVGKFIKTLELELIECNNDIAFCESNLNEIETFLEKCLFSFEGLKTVSPLLFHHHVLQGTFFNFLDSIIHFVENLEEHYCIEQLMMNISTDFRETFRLLLTLADNVIASAYALFRAIISCIISTDELYTIIINSLQYERFIFYYSIIYPIDEILNRLDGEQKMYIITRFEHIRGNCTRHILEQLKKRGMLVGLGSSKNREVQNQIDYVAELLPHFSPQFIHLCLRHFGYQAEQTANALLTISELPLDLQALMSVELKAENAPAIATGCFPFYDFTDDETFDHNSKTNWTKPSDAMICMKLPQLSTNKQEVGSVINCQSVTESKIGNNRQEVLKAEFGVESFLKGRKMSAAIENVSSFTETFDVPNSEKVALRPTYERYRYVETTSLEYNLYDDEYDDTYDDQCQSYDFEIREGDIAIEKNEIEPNTNRIQVDSEVDESVESEGRKKVGENNARMKKHLKNGRKVINTVATDEKNQNNAHSRRAKEVGHSSKNGPNENRRSGYTGGRERQLKERHKGEFRRKQADKKMRNVI